MHGRGVCMVLNERGYSRECSGGQFVKGKGEDEKCYTTAGSPNER